MEFVSSELSIFQAIGTICGKPFKDENLGWGIDISGNVFRLFIPPTKYRAWLKQTENNKKLYLTVYPRSLIVPKQPPTIFFQVVGWSEKSQQLPVNMFVIKGLWQFIPQVKIHVLSVYRNKQAKDVLNKYKANHIPIFMRREDCKPYRFNKVDEKLKAEKYFVQANFKFLPERQCFGYQSDIAQPTLEAPGYRKPKKPQVETKKKMVLTTESCQP
jgi:hypothetical protein